MLRALGKDPLVIKETRIDVLYGLSNLMDEAYRSAERFKSKALLLYGEKDEFIPRAPVENFYHRLPLRDQGLQQMILYKNGYHMLFRDVQADVVQKDIARWLEIKWGQVLKICKMRLVWKNGGVRIHSAILLLR